MKSRLRTVLKLLSIFLLWSWLLTGCNGPNGPIIEAQEAFMLTYIDRNERLQVRYSSDGLSWEPATVPAGLSDAGVGTASSADTIGAIRLLAHSGTTGRLRLRFGLGPAFWEDDALEFDDIRPHGAPRVTQSATNRWMITGLGGSLNGQAVVRLFDSTSQQFTVVTPSGLSGLNNSTIHRPPAVISRHGRVILSWLRFSAMGDINTRPVELQIVVGDVDTDGQPNWTNAYTFSQAEPDFGPVLSEPAFTHDHAFFYLGVIRKDSIYSLPHLLIYRSLDGSRWEMHTILENAPFSEGTTVQIAAHADGTMLAGLIGLNSSRLYRTTGGEWFEICPDNVFGAEEPSFVPFSLIAAGGPEEQVYVDAGNVAGPWKGSEDSPFQTIQEGINAAGAGDTVFIKGGLYQESLNVPQGINLRSWQGLVDTPIIQGGSGAPTIRLAGNNQLSELDVQDGSPGILFDIDSALSSQCMTHFEVTDTRMRGNNFGILVETPSDLSFASNQRRRVFIDIQRNWFQYNVGAGIQSELMGPSTGELVFYPHIRDNVFQSQFTAIFLEAVGRGPNPGGFVRAMYAGKGIINNLIFGGTNGILLSGENLGSVDVIIANNTIAHNGSHGIIASSDTGSNGRGSAHPIVNRNIIANNGGFGYEEFGLKTSARELNNNLFYHNARGHYADEETLTVAMDEQALNTPIVDGKVVFYSGSGNIVSDPLFAEGGFRWTQNLIDFGEPGDYFLQQENGATSPAVNAGQLTAAFVGLDNRSTRTDYLPDTGDVDLGFHYRDP